MLSPRIHFTPREKTIVDALVSGATNKDIAARLGLSEQSVKNRLCALFRKAGVTNRLQLAVSWMHDHRNGAPGDRYFSHD